ncbi:MAG: Na+/H+ antiporter NhaA [Coriobacteriia bacterium]|nr:Na+/H+ antiporter NhaA [Coriobacteriia bacterium]
MSPHRQDDAAYIDEVSKHRKRRARVIELTHSSTKAAGVMLLATIAALIVASTGAHEGFTHFWHTEVVVGFGDATARMGLGHVINDVFMAIFFLLVGLEIKYEMTVGELTNIRQAILPVMAAVGGVAMPAAIFVACNASSPDTVMGWGIPTATDIAFALGVLALLGDRVPSGVRVFLSTLAVADDIIAILIIAVFYGQSPDVMWLLAAGVTFVVLAVMNKCHVYSLVPYLIGGVVLWFCVYSSGVHATIAGVLLAFVIPSGSHVNLAGFVDWSGKRVCEAKESYEPDVPVIGQGDYLASVSRLAAVSRHVVPPATRLERALHPWVNFAILPLFALTNADVSLLGVDLMSVATSPVFLGVLLGLLLGKPAGIMLMSFVIVKTGVAKLPENVNWAHVLGASLLGGMGFTMAIFVANLAFVDASYVAFAKMAILLASLLAGVLGFAFLFLQARGAAAKGDHFVTHIPESTNLQTHVSHEAARQARCAEGLKE